PHCTVDLARLVADQHPARYRHDATAGSNAERLDEGRVGGGAAGELAPPKPMPKAPQALPPAISGRSRLDPSSRFNAVRWPPASSTATVSGLKLSSRPFSKALSTIIEACSKVSIRSPPGVQCAVCRISFAP